MNSSDLSKYETVEGYKNLYIVDTINIKDPIIVTTSNDHRFILPKKKLEMYNGKESFFYENDDVFIYESYLPMQLPSKVYSLYAKGSDCSENLVVIENLKYKNIWQIQEYKTSPDYFILVLIQGNYFNSVYTGFHTYSPYDLEYNKFSYYRVAIPFCL